MSENLRENTHISGSNAIYIAEVYEKYLQDPSSVDVSWREYFDNIGDNAANLNGDFGGASWGRNKTQIVGYREPISERRGSKGKGRRAADGDIVNQASSDSIHAHMLIRAYRVRGHLAATLDPLGIKGNFSHPELDPARYGFGENDYDREIYLDGWLGKDKATLREILAILKETYSSNLAIEFIHIQSLEKKEWLENKLESTRSKPSYSSEQKKKILQKLVEAVGFEEFLHKKYPGVKRFSGEGGDALLTAMEASVEAAANLGVGEVVLGMPHRGRLNVLTAFMGKPYVAMLSEFQGNQATPDWINSSGDVKYHLGISTDKKFGENQVHLSLTANPSHLEAVNPVVCGKVRAKQDQLDDTNRDKVMGLLLHGDASFCGQGIVAETLALSDLEGYKTGGTVHIVVNNQVGFTTNPEQGHLSPYPTDVAMTIQAPIFHVNGDDPEAVAHAAEIAAQYRQKFKKDVVIDIWCYRKHGHNEGDEPRWTQPLMYKRVDQKETPRDIYAKKLIAEGTLSADEFEKMQKDFYDILEDAYTKCNDYKPEKADMLEGKWEGIRQVKRGEKKKLGTGVDVKKLKEIGRKLSTKPAGAKLHRGVEKVLENRSKMIDSGEGLDWATAEALAFGSLLEEGTPIRISGQDVKRGTFSHRHSVMWDQETEKEYCNLNNISKKQAKYEAINSNLSEFAVLGYEYGYSSAEPKALTLWEGQFGDFVNGAQTIIDQFISSAEVKWLRMSGLVMLLPHGYEGQGPEHSSARVERFLQQSAEDNWIVANCTTPANYFHILRRQIKRDFRKPLILMSPKSLLRHKRAQSDLKDLGKDTSFHRVISETEKLVASDKVKRVIFCTGKVYYDLLEAREEKKIKDIALVRVEQIYPFPYSVVEAEIKKYGKAEIVWVQEEPQNMGCWNFVDRRLEQAAKNVKAKDPRPKYVGRPEAAATACGYMKIHTKEQQTLIDEALGKTKIKEIILDK